MKYSIILLSILFCGVINFVSAQTFIKSYSVGGVPANCDAQVVASGLNIPAGSELFFVDPNDWSLIYPNVSFSDTLTGLCEDSWYGILGGYMLRTLQGDTIARSNIGPIGFDYQLSNYVAPSSPVSHDGSITITFPTVLDIGSIGAYAVLFFNNGYTVNPVTSDNKTFVLNNLGQGQLFVSLTYQDYDASFSAYIGDINNSGVNNNLLVDLLVNDSDNNCSGSANLIPDPLATGITYTWSEPSLNGMSNISNLCPNIYSVLVTDDLGNNRVLEFMISDTTQDYYYPWLNPSSATDTLDFLIESCAIDYTQNLDSIAWYETLLSISGDTNFYQLNLSLYQGLNAIDFTQNFYITTDSLVILQIGFYCLGFKTNVFDGFKVNLSRDGSQNSFVLNVADKEIDHISVYPNPFDDELLLKTSKKDSYSVAIRDAQGKLVFKEHYAFKDTIHINVPTLDKGVYFISVESNETSVTRKLVH